MFFSGYLQKELCTEIMTIFAVPMKRGFIILLLAAVTLLVSSCGAVRLRGSQHYYAGEPVQKGYTPAGTVKEVYHGCSVPGPTYRRMIVYLPPDYDRFDSRRYPVLYLLHGARGHETSWIKKGKVLQIADSLYASGAAEQMIIVLPNVNQYNNDIDMEGGRLKDAFESIMEIDGRVESGFMEDVVKEVDSLFLTIPDRDHRAIAGLSIGATKGAVISAADGISFGNVGLLSPCFTITGLPNRQRRAIYGPFPGNVPGQFEASSPKYSIYIGKNDYLKFTVDSYHNYLTRHNCEHDYIVVPGGHKWTAWRTSLSDYLCKLFK